MSAEKPFTKENLSAFYEQCKLLEQENRDILIVFQEKYPDVLNVDNLLDVLTAAEAKKKRII